MYFEKHKNEIQKLLLDPSLLVSSVKEMKKYKIQHLFWSFLGELYKNKCYRPLRIEYLPGSYKQSHLFHESFVFHKKKEDNEKIQQLIYFYMFNPLKEINYKEKLVLFWDKDCDNNTLYKKNIEINNLNLNEGEIFYLEHKIKNLTSYEEYQKEKNPICIDNIFKKMLDNLVTDCFILQAEVILRSEYVKNYQMVFNDYDQGIHFTNKKLTKKYKQQLNIINEYLTYFASYEDSKKCDRDTLHYIGKNIKNLIKKTNGLNYIGIKEKFNGIENPNVYEDYLLSVSRDIEKELLSKLIVINNDNFNKTFLRI